MVILLGLTMMLPSSATTGDSGGTRAERAQLHIGRLISAGDVPGIQYEVVGADGVLFSTAAGVRDVASGAPMEEATIQMAYSTTKVITAVVVMQLVERGRMELDAPLSRYYPDHPYGTGVTIRQLLAHTSGVPAPMPLDWFAVEDRAFDRDQELGRLLAKHPRLRHQPGQKYGYSNLGYWLLEKAIERQSGQDYAAYVEEHVFHPVGVTGAAARFSMDGPGDLAVGHARRISGLTWMLKLMTPAAYWRGAHGRWYRSARVVPYGRAYGGLFVTAHAFGSVLRDLVKDDSVLLRAESKAALFPLGWVTGELAGERYFGKQGGGLGFSGNVRVYPARGIATVLVANRTEISPGPIDARSDALDAIFVAGQGSK